MQRLFLASLTVLALLAGSLLADDKEKKDKDAPKPSNVSVTKVDAKKGEITVKFTDATGKEHEKTYQLTKDVHLFDETGRVVTIDVFESGNAALIVENEGKLTELRRAGRRARDRTLSDSIKTLIEMSDSDEKCAEEVQHIYAMLRKLDTEKNGKIDAKELKAASNHILEARVKEFFDRLDTNKDGKISKDEAKGLLKEHFDKIDTNKDGFIDFDELLKAAKEKHNTKPTDTKPSDTKPSDKKPSDKEKN